MATPHSTTYRLPIKDFPGYAVSQDGKIWSCWVKGPLSRLADRWKELKLTAASRGYLIVCLQHNNKRHTKRVHRLVLEAFVGPCPKWMECRHLDGNPANNLLSNLKWGTKKENGEDTVRHGTSTKGERHGQSKLTSDQVRNIRLSYAKESWTQKQLATKYGVTQGTICAILTRRRWSWLEDGDE